METYKRADIYQQVTDTIIELLTNKIQSNGTEHWTNIDGAFPHNVTTRKNYNGLNSLLLCYVFAKNKYTANAWLTFKQLQEHGGKVIKGSKSTIIVFNDYLYYDEKGKKINSEAFINLSAEQKKKVNKVFYLKHYNVFNVAQVEGLPAAFYDTPETKTLTEFEKDEHAEILLNQSGAKINYMIGNRAFYAPATDEITLPVRGQFKGKLSFYSVAFHELGHWTGHETRLNREVKNKFGSDKYAKEELVAELTSAFICASLGFSETITDNATYIQNWLTALQNDKRFIVSASSLASRAAEYIVTPSLHQKIAA